MKAEILNANIPHKSQDLKDLVGDVERMHAEATVGGHKFLAYLLDMARIEATTLLRASTGPARPTSST